MVRFSLTGGGPPSGPQIELIKDAIWAHASADGGVEHVTVAGGRAVEIVIFVRSGITDPDRYAQAVVVSACAASPALRTWSAIMCRPLPRDGDVTL